jgi:hypothetical protein
MAGYGRVKSQTSYFDGLLDGRLKGHEQLILVQVCGHDAFYN